jgi:Cu-processing system permease protein
MGALSSLKRVIAVASLTFREAWRRRVVLAAAVMALGFLAIYGAGLHFVADQIGHGLSFDAELSHRGAAVQMLALGLYTSSLLIALTAVFVSAGSVSAEVDGVIYGVLSRPVRRWEIVVGKFIGLVVMLSVFDAALNAAVIGLARWLMAVPLVSWPVGMALLVLEPLPLLALALLGSSRLPTLANGVLCTAAFGIGLLGGMMEQVDGLVSRVVSMAGGIHSGTLTYLGIVTSLLMPLDAVHRLALGALLPQGLESFGPLPGLGGGTDALVPSNGMMIYAGAYVFVMLLLAARAFSARDL